MNHEQVAAAVSGANASATGIKQNQGKYVPTGTGPAYWGPGDEVTFLLTGKETDGHSLFPNSRSRRKEVRRRTFTVSRMSRFTSGRGHWRLWWATKR